MIKRRNELACCQIAARPENNDGTRLREFPLHSDVADLPVELFSIHSQTMEQHGKKFNPNKKFSLPGRPFPKILTRA
jgi:hypothetical protein